MSGFLPLYFLFLSLTWCIPLILCPFIFSTLHISVVVVAQRATLLYAAAFVSHILGVRGESGICYMLLFCRQIWFWQRIYFVSDPQYLQVCQTRWQNKLISHNCFAICNDKTYLLFNSLFAALTWLFTAALHNPIISVWIQIIFKSRVPKQLKVKYYVTDCVVVWVWWSLRQIINFDMWLQLVGKTRFAIKQ